MPLGEALPGAAHGGAAGGENTAKTEDEVLDKKEEMEMA